MAIEAGAEETQLPLKTGVVVIIDGVTYSEKTNGVPTDIGILFIAKNFSRYILFEEITGIEAKIEKALAETDVVVLDINNDNDTDIFIFGLVTRMPIKVVIAILKDIMGTQVDKPYSKAKTQNIILNLETGNFDLLKDYCENWLEDGTVSGKTISIEGIVEDIGKEA